MSEEVRKAKSAVPRAMFWSIFMNGVLGYIMVMVILVSMGTVEDALASTSPIVAILLHVTGSTAATTAMVAGLFIISFAINLANIASVSRLTWACGRDGVLPKQLAYVSGHHLHCTVRILLTGVEGRSEASSSSPSCLASCAPCQCPLLAERQQFELCRIRSHYGTLVHCVVYILCYCHWEYVVHKVL